MISEKLTPIPYSLCPSFDKFVDDFFCFFPVGFVFVVKCFPLFGDGVIPSPCPGVFVTPIGADQPGVFQAVKGGVKGRFLEFVLSAGFFLDRLV